MGFTVKDLNARFNKEMETRTRETDLAYEEFKASLVEKDEKQQQVLYTKDPQYVVTGSAGSGKTIVAMMKALELETKGYDYIIIIYTKTLKYFLEGKMKKGNFKDIENKIYYRDELISNKSKDEELRNKSVDYVIIDEVQDFPVECVQDYIMLGKKGYFLYGDNGQQIYPDQTHNRDVIREIKENLPVSEFALERTYRVPKKIAKFAEQIDKRNTHISKDCYKTEGEKPLVTSFQDFDSEMRYIIDMIKQESWKNVGILLRNNDDVTIVAERLNQLGLTCEQKDKNIDNIDFSTDNPKVITYHSSKGLEFERVFIPQCAFNSNPKKYNYREALFVAMTRAKESLLVSYQVGNKSQYIDEIDMNTYIFQSK